MILRLFLLLLTATQLHAMLDLDSMTQPWILETRQICIPGHPTAFNASIVEWGDAYLMSFRVRNPDSGKTDQFGFVWLDAQMQVTTTPQLIDMRNFNPFGQSWPQDARLVKAGECLFIVYNDIVPFLNGWSPRMFIARVAICEGKIAVSAPTVLLESDSSYPFRKEKNWVPFDFEGNLLLAYSLNPHHIFLPRGDSCFCDTVASSTSVIKWYWGILRGGTPALRVGDRYLGFFHSVKDLITVQSDGERMVHYFMGAYTFSADPPFELLTISPCPIIATTFYNGPAYQTWKPLRVVFPCGFVCQGEYVWVTYGRQDHEIWMVKLDRQALLQSLLPISTNE